MVWHFWACHCAQASVFMVIHLCPSPYAKVITWALRQTDAELIVFYSKSVCVLSSLVPTLPSWGHSPICWLLCIIAAAALSTSVGLLAIVANPREKSLQVIKDLTPELVLCLQHNKHGYCRKNASRKLRQCVVLYVFWSGHCTLWYTPYIYRHLWRDEARNHNTPKDTYLHW